jgi:SAM-dependent methyltransferase
MAHVAHDSNSVTRTDQTQRSFRDKWTNTPRLAFDETLREGSGIFTWLLTRNGFQTVEELRAWLAGRGRVLDAGCGNGRVTALLRRYAPPTTDIVGIDLNAADVARTNLEGEDRVSVFAMDLLGDLAPLGQFDLIYCQEVLHHTSDPAVAFRNLVGRLRPGGELAIYVYRVKAPIREHADDFIRERVANLTYADAMEVMKGLTGLGKALSELSTRVTVPDVPVIGLEAGEYDVQRLIYHLFLKCFWNPDLAFDENSAINYDWYHPQLSSRHTVPEVESWFIDSGLTIAHRCVDPYGITVRGHRA